jgi:hypothetical protein
MPAWAWTLIALAAVVVTAGVVTTWLWIVAEQARAGTDRAAALLDAVRTGLAAAAGAGAAVGLMLAFRRQHHQEISTVLTDSDAVERRITDLYAKAAELLGSDKAAARLAGLYALERLGQDNAGHRQTVVNVICAYLRMPFAAPADWSSRSAIVSGAGHAAADHEAGSYDELQVRLSAEDILASHSRDVRPLDERFGVPDDPGFWPEIELNLSGAALMNVNCWVSCRLSDADFSAATFVDGANFANSHFGQVFFGNARFEKGSAHFYNALVRRSRGICRYRLRPAGGEF